MKRYSLFLIGLFLSFHSFSISIDSLTLLLTQPGLTTQQRLNTYNELAKAYNLTSSDSAFKYNGLAISLAEDYPLSQEKIYAYLGQANLLNGRYEAKKARKAAEKALNLARKFQDIKLETNALKELGLALKNATLYDTATVVIRQTIELARNNKDMAIESASENVMAQIFSRQQQYDSSIFHYQAAVRLGEMANRPKETLAPLYNMGIVHYNLGNYDSTQAIMYKITRIAGKQNASRIQGAAHSVLANMFSAEGKIDSAMDHIERGIAISDSLSVERMYGYYNLADIYMQEGKHESSLAYWKLALAQSIGVNSIAQADMLKGLGQLFLDWGKLDSALHYLNLSEATAKRFGSTESLGQLRLLRAQTLSKMEDYRGAIRTIGPALEAKEISIARSGYFYKGNYHKNLKEFSQAKSSYLKALEMFQQSKETKSISMCYYNLAICDSSMGNKSSALSYMSLYANEETARLKERYKESVAEYETKFETAEKETQIKSLEQGKRIQDLEIAQTTAQRNTLLGIALVLLLAGGAIFALFVRIRQQREALAQANATKDRLFSIISHDLRGPVTGLQTAGKIFTHHLEKGNVGVLKAISQQVDQQAGQVRRLLDNLLTWSLQQLGVYEAKAETFPFQPFGKEILGYYQQAAQAKGIALKLDVAPDLQLHTDRRGLSVILTNLVNNAVKFTEEGEVLLSAQLEGGKARISVKDSGTGMPKDKIAKLRRGEMLSSERGTKGEKGTGLGWQIIHELIARWGGEIEIESVEGEGTEVIMSL